MTFRDIVNAGLHRATLAALRIRLGLQRWLRLTHEYQPDPFATATPSSIDPRACAARFSAFAAALPPVKRPSVIDIGCNQGYFTFQMAKSGGLCLGLDTDRNEIMVAGARATLHRVRNAAFLELRVDAQTARVLPEVDFVLCLSVFHHWVRHLGVDAASEIMQALAAKARHGLVFETGQPDEVDAKWAGQLSFMGPDSSRWTKDFLRNLGFATVQEVGTFPTTVSSVHRTLYVAQRD